ncbi:MAG: phosphate uptake regulator, PhoU [Gemmataceae bacterium]|nr:phosphate uptake regulator, PhoU [Gemmataceae bacterium]
MPKHLQKDLEELHRSLLRLAGYVEDAVVNATAALRTRDRDGGRRVIAGDNEIDQLENEVQDECLKILALHQPVAVDLRRISVVLMITTDLERMGDLAVGIAERAIALARPPYVPIPERIEGMTDRTLRMVRLSLDAFVNGDPIEAARVIRADDDVDRDNDEIIRELVAEMKQSPHLVEPALSLFSAVRHLERIADHATNIAEDVIYLVNGEIVRHHPEALGGG